MNQYTCVAHYNGIQYPWTVKAQNLAHAEHGFEQWLYGDTGLYLTKDCADYWLVAKAEHLTND